jgi:predicted  nucleic acid-binding Zn-ribbon protein
VLSINPQRKQEAAMSMYFYDETDDWPEYQIIKDDIHRLEKEHVEIRKKLREAESAFGPEDSDTALHAKVHGLKKKMEEIEQKLDGSLRLYR